MRPVAIYPGSFDPPTLGHLDVIQRSSSLFERLIVSVGINSSKKPFLSVEERIECLKDVTSHLKNVEVTSFQGMLIDHVRTTGSNAIVRGLRAIADFEYEFQLAMVNRRLAPEIETIFLMTNWEHSYLSSSIVREVATLGGNYTELVPERAVNFIETALLRHRTT